jgi:hypothetical protein
MKMPRSQRITIEQIKEASEEIRRSQKRSRPHRIIIKKKYNAPEVKSAPQEKDKEKIYFPEDRSTLLEKTPAQSSINKGDAFLICHTHSLIYSASLVESSSCSYPARKEGRRAQVG